VIAGAAGALLGLGDLVAIVGDRGGAGALQIHGLGE
jgi:hypothetical protein